MRIRLLPCVTLMFALGILAAKFAGAAPMLLVLVQFLLLASLLVLSRSKIRLLAILIAFTLLGSLRQLCAQEEGRTLQRLPDGQLQVTGRIASYPTLHHAADSHSTGYFSAQLELCELHMEGSTIRLAGEQIRISLPEKASGELPVYGCFIEANGKLETSQGPANPGSFDWTGYQEAGGIYKQLKVRRTSDWRLLLQGSSASPLVFGSAIRSRLEAHFHRRHLPERAALLTAVLYGDRANLPPSLSDAFQCTGTMHLLATGGLHLGIVTVLWMGLLRRLRLPRRGRLTGALLMIGAILLLTGVRAAAGRAGIVLAIYLLGELLEHEPDWLNATALAALILLTLRPAMLFESGFQLSFAVVITLVLASPLLKHESLLSYEQIHESRLRKTLNHLKESFQTYLWVVVFAQLGSLGFAAYYDHQIPLYAVLANLVMVPLVVPVIALGWLSPVIAAVCPILSNPIDWLLNLLMALLSGIANAFYALPLSSIHIGEMPWGFVLCWYLLIWGGLICLRKQTLPRLALRSPDLNLQR